MYRALNDLADSGGFQAWMHEPGVIADILAAMRAHPANSEIQRFACRCDS